MSLINWSHLILFQDKDLNVHVYREEPDDENAESWKLICRYTYCEMLSNIVLKF